MVKGCCHLYSWLSISLLLLFIASLVINSRWHCKEAEFSSILCCYVFSAAIFSVSYVLINSISLLYEQVIDYYAKKGVLAELHAEKPPKEVTAEVQKALSS